MGCGGPLQVRAADHLTIADQAACEAAAARGAAPQKHLNQGRDSSAWRFLSISA